MASGHGKSGDDILLGTDGGYKLIGGAGADLLDGGNGDDKLVGGSGGDILLDGNDKEACFQMALNASSAQSLRNLEKSLGANQADASESHIRGGEIGKWKHYYDAADVDFAERAPRRFGLSLEAFEIE